MVTFDLDRDLCCWTAVPILADQWLYWAGLVDDGITTSRGLYVPHFVDEREK